jgi:hypothetical protein
MRRVVGPPAEPAVLGRSLGAMVGGTEALEILERIGPAPASRDDVIDLRRRHRMPLGEAEDTERLPSEHAEPQSFPLATIPVPSGSRVPADGPLVLGAERALGNLVLATRNDAVSHDLVRQRRAPSTTRRVDADRL